MLQKNGGDFILNGLKELSLKFILHLLQSSVISFNIRKYCAFFVHKNVYLYIFMYELL